MKLVKQNHVKYGLIMVGVLIGCITLMEITGQNESFENKSPIFLIYQFIVPAIVWTLGIRAKKKELGGKLTFGQGLKEGFKISLVFGLISPFIFALYYLLVNPEILEYVKKSYNLTQASDEFTIGVDMILQFLFSLIFGTLYSIIISLFLRTKKS